ncbi:hypothetical protein [Bifidobacterium breve]|uniref:hypothetical protein n=1 Tax=Bifidobacterium breve TaxID=1685 RepID=UPI00254FBBBB|nr:hypothetical protein [Bifidobacterium breve]MDK7091765.1 hypothetical protein [Bifidobacterium breve]
MDKIFKFNTLNQPTRYPVDLDRLGINVYDVAPKWVYQDGRRTDVQATSKDGVPRWTIKAILTPQGRASGAPAEITYYSEERPEVMGAATFASLDVSVWHMPERDMAGIALRGSGLRSLGSSPAVADEGEVEL